MSWLVGVDVGGTFTDFLRVQLGRRQPALFQAAVDAGQSGRGHRHGPARDVRNARYRSGGVSTGFATAPPSPRMRLSSAAAATSHSLPPKASATCLEIGRQIRPHMYSLQEDQPDPLVPRARRFEVAERTSLGDGDVLVDPRRRRSIDAAVEAVEASGAESPAPSAASSPSSTVNTRSASATHCAPACRKMDVSLSSEVRPEFREYERFLHDRAERLPPAGYR